MSSRVVVRLRGKVRKWGKWVDSVGSWLGGEVVGPSTRVDASEIRRRKGRSRRGRKHIRLVEHEREKQEKMEREEEEREREEREGKK